MKKKYYSRQIINITFELRLN